MTDREKTRKKNRLKKLVVTRIDLVDRGAAPDADIKLYKRDHDQEVNNMRDDFSEFAGFTKKDYEAGVHEVALEAFYKGEYATIEEAVSDVWLSDPQLYDHYRMAPDAPPDDLGPSLVEKSLDARDQTGRDLADRAITAIAKSMRASMNQNDPASWQTSDEEFYFKAASSEVGTKLWDFLSSDPLAREPVAELRARVRKDGSDNRLGEVLGIADHYLSGRW